MSVPEDIASSAGHESGVQLFESLDDIFDVKRPKKNGKVYEMYKNYISDTLASLRDEGRKFGALIIEPVILGAGGMIFA